MNTKDMERTHWSRDRTWKALALLDAGAFYHRFHNTPKSTCKIVLELGCTEKIALSQKKNWTGGPHKHRAPKVRVGVRWAYFSISLNWHEVEYVFNVSPAWEQDVRLDVRESHSVANWLARNWSLVHNWEFCHMWMLVLMLLVFMRARRTEQIRHGGRKKEQSNASLAAVY